MRKLALASLVSSLLSACDGGGVKACIFGIWLRPTECITDGLRVLCSEQHPHHLTAILVMLKNFLTDQLALAIAIGREPGVAAPGPSYC